ncbi:hypothetical protein HNR29_007189, partial [Rhizobium leguminosarum]|nr:hypothetical protein [Rhizobium leguminosarum]
KCAGEKSWLWRAVDQHGTVLEEILQKRRDKGAAKRVLVALMKRYGFAPKRIITDKLRSYGAAKAEVAPGLDHWWHKGLDLAPKFYPVLSSLQRFLVAVVGSVAAGCGAEPFRLRSTASRRGLMV